jgi:hypothetical protein
MAVMVLDVYERRGLTPYGWCGQREERAAGPGLFTAEPSSTSSHAAGGGVRSTGAMLAESDAMRAMCWPPRPEPGRGIARLDALRCPLDASGRSAAVRPR